MKTPSPVRAVAEVLAAVPLFAAAPLLRHWHVRWGATDAEVAAAMPGDEIEPIARVRATRAISVDAAPEAVWPWIVQIGFGDYPMMRKLPLGIKRRAEQAEHSLR